MSMQKYVKIFSISLQQEFAYRINFLIWRFRNIIQILLMFYLWSAVFTENSGTVFGYSKDKILIYVFGLLLVRPLVTGAKSMDIAGEISDGRLTNYLVRPLNYFKYWFSRDLASKSLNLVFAISEFTILFLIFKPPFFLQTNPLNLLLFIFSLIFAIILFFLLLLFFSSFVMWYPENAWGAMFMLGIFVEFLGGGIFPLDILPGTVSGLIYATPFPYLLFMPLQIYLGKIPLVMIAQSLGIAILWIVILYFLVKFLWLKGLKVYEAHGR